MRWVFDGIYLLALGLTLPYWIYKSLTAGKYRNGLWRKLTGTGVREFVPDGRPVVWFHAVSVGEVLLLKPLLARFAIGRPDLQIALSSTTETGYAVAKQNYPTLAVFFAPLDFSWGVRRVFDTIGPELLVLAELELWPNLLLEAKRRSIPLAVVNARMSERSHRGYMRGRLFLRKPLSAINWWGIQTEDYATRIQHLVADDVHFSNPQSAQNAPLRVAANREENCISNPQSAIRNPQFLITGSMKYDGAPTNRDNPKTCELRRLFGFHTTERIWVAGSTQGPEDAMILDAFLKIRGNHPELRLVLVPRHKERFEEVANLIADRGLDLARRSQIQSPLSQSKSVTLVDTIGELSAVWGLANFGYVGGSLDGVRGGQSMIEPAGYGVPTCFGPHTWNFRDTVQRLTACGGGKTLASAAEIAPTLMGWLTDRESAIDMGRRARAFIVSQQGAVEKTFTALASLIGKNETSRLSA